MVKNGAADDLIQGNVLTILDNYEIYWFTLELLKMAQGSGRVVAVAIQAGTGYAVTYQ